MCFQYVSTTVLVVPAGACAYLIGRVGIIHTTQENSNFSCHVLKNSLHVLRSSPGVESDGRTTTDDSQEGLTRGPGC